MELTIINSFEYFQSLRDDWNGQLTNSPNDSLFMRHEWLSAWLESYGRHHKLQVLLLKENNGPVGIAPLVITQERIYGLPVEKMTFICDSAWTSGDFITPQHATEAIERFVETFKEKEFDMIDFQNIPIESQTISALLESLSRKGYRFVTKEGSNSPFIQIDRSWNDFYGQLSAKFRKVMRNKLNRIKKIGNFSVKKYSSPEEVLKILPVIFEIGTRGWKHKIKNSISSTENNRSFYTKLTEAFGALGWVTIWLLELNDSPVAFEYHISYKNTVHALIADYDERYRDLAPGSILDYSIMQHIFEKQPCTYDMGCGNSFYKMNWTDDTKKHLRILVYSDTTYGKLLRQIESTFMPFAKRIRSRLKRFAKGQESHA